MSQATNDRPNILFIMSDEHDAAVLGCYGDELVQTPHLDGLAERGVRFDACYCNSPLCVPSRLSFTAGQYISRFGGWSNSAWLPTDDYPGIAHAMNAAGYETFLCGKQHYDATRRYGFTDILPGVNSRQGSNGSHKTGLGNRKAPDEAYIHRPAWLDRSGDFHPGEHSGVLSHDRAVTHTARGFLSARKRSDAPFFMFAGYVAPHFPMIAPQPYTDRYYGRTPPPIGRPNWEPIGNDDPLFNLNQLRRGFGLVHANVNVERRGRDQYWALTNWFDNEIGKLLRALNDSDVADNTVVIYTSDHGENKGDHGLWWKNNLYDHGARVPLIVSWPARWAGGQRRSEACSLVDVVQTLLAIGDAEPHEQMDGDNMLPWLDDASHSWKDFALSEYYGHNIASGMTMVRQGDFKYIYHARANEQFGPQRELYHMRDDPHELHNLADDAAQAERLEQLHAAMLNELDEDPDDIEQRCRREEAAGYDR